MKKSKILTVPIASSQSFREPKIALEQGDLLVSLFLEDETKDRCFDLRFVRQRAFRKRSEIYCTSWHVDGTYDTVCEVEDSDWRRELYANAVPQLRDQWTLRHFIIYIDSFGCLEVMAESVMIVEVDKVI